MDDGACAHLMGARIPSVGLASTRGGNVDLSTMRERFVVYAYPRTGTPDRSPLVPDWNMIPGARGCTPQSCAFRDHYAELKAEGAAEVFGLSTQDAIYQREMAERLHLPFAVLSDSDLCFTRALRLPTFVVAGQELMKRLTFVVCGGVIEKVFYPVFPPDKNAEEVAVWLRSQK